MNFEENVMFKTLMMAATAITLMSGVGFAETSVTSSTTESNQVVAPPTHDVQESTTVKRTSDRNGVMIEKDTVGTSVDKPADVATTRTRTDTTTVR
jgi:hypothetical protein